MIIPEPEQKITRIFYLRSSNITSLMTIDLEWVSCILKKQIVNNLGGRYFQEAIWLEGKLRLIITDLMEKANFETESLINALNTLKIPVVGYKNDLLEAYLEAGYYSIIVNHELPNDAKDSEKHETESISDSLYAEGRIINRAKPTVTKILREDLLAIAIKFFKPHLITHIHDYCEIPASKPLYTSNEELWEAQIEKIRNERSNLNPDGT